MNTKKVLLFLATGLLGAIPITIQATNKPLNVSMARTSAYTCASIHLGMNDDTKKAITFTSNSVGPNLIYNPYYTYDNVALVNCLSTNVYYDTTHNYAVRVGTPQTQGTLTLKFDRQVIYTTLYIYVPTKTNITINGEQRTISRSNQKLTDYKETLITYAPTSFNLELTDTLVITAKNLYIADITLRTM